VFLVVPAEKSLRKSATVLNASETGWELRSIFHGAELTFRIGIVVGDMRTAVRFGEGQVAMRALKEFLKRDGLVFQSRQHGPLAETMILTQGLHPAVKALGLPKAGMHAFRRGCNRRWELARVSAAVIRQQMGHASASMTAHYTGEIPVEVVKNFLQLDSNGAAKAA